MKKTHTDDLIAGAACLARNAEECVSDRRFSRDACDALAAHIAGLVETGRRQTHLARMVGCDTDTLPGLLQGDYGTARAFVDQAAEQGWVGYSAASEYAGVSAITVKRAVAAGAVARQGRVCHRPARLAPGSVIRWRYAVPCPHAPRARENLLLWRTLLTDAADLPAAIPAARNDDRWQVLNACLAPVAAPPPASLVRATREYTVGEIAFLQGTITVRRRKEKMGSEERLPLVRWALDAAECLGSDAGDLLRLVVRVPFVCPDCGDKMGRHQGRVITESVNGDKGQHEYHLRCQVCGRRWSERLTYDEYKGYARKMFQALNAELPPEYQLAPDAYRRAVGATLADVAARRGVFPQVRTCDVAQAFGVSSASVSQTTARLHARGYIVAPDHLLGCLSRLVVRFGSVRPVLRHCFPSLFTITTDATLAPLFA